MAETTELFSVDVEAENLLKHLYDPSFQSEVEENMLTAPIPEVGAVEEEMSSYKKDQQHKKILIIGNQNEFLVGSIKTALINKKFEVTICEPSITEVSKVDDDILLYLVMIEYVSEVSKLLIYLHDKAFDKHIRICLISHKGEANDALKIIPEDDVSKIFYRPVNTKEVVTELENIYTKSNGEAKKRAILLIDDDPAFLKRTQNILRNDYKTYMVTSGAAAIKMMANHHVDLILLDYDMPIIDGPHVYQMIKAESDFANIPIMFLSGKNDVESVKTAVLLKPEKYIAKTMKAAELLSTINDFFVYR